MNERDFKQRMIGAVVLIALAVIFLPILLNGEADDGMPLFGSNIPERHKSITNMQPLNLTSKISPPETKSVETIVVDELSPNIIDQQNDSNVASSVISQAEQVNSSKDEHLTKAIVKDETQIKPVKLTAVAWIIQVGSFSSKENAIALQNKLRSKKYHAFVEAVTKKSDTSYRVRIGPEVKKNNAVLTQKRLKKELKINGIVMIYKG